MTPNSIPKKTRSRNGCWTCRQRKKKCDENFPSCRNCQRLGLSCDRTPQILWEDDERREGMRKRGPRGRIIHQNRVRSTSAAIDHSSDIGSYESNADSTSLVGDSQDQHYFKSRLDPDSTIENESVQLEKRSGTHDLRRSPSSYPFKLTSNQSILFEHYLHRFSRTYPSCSGPANPFLSVLVPLALSSKAVLSSILAVSGAQMWTNQNLEYDVLKAKQNSLRACRVLLNKSEQIKMLRNMTVPNEDIISHRRNIDRCFDNEAAQTDLLHLTCSVTMLLVYEKLSGGDKKSWKPHLDFIAYLFRDNYLVSKLLESSEAFRFLHNIFVYNDLVGSTSLKTKTISKFYIESVENRTAIIPFDEDSNFNTTELATTDSNRYYYPSLISRICSGDRSVSLSEIEKWDGRMDWLPSYCLEPDLKTNSNPELQQSTDEYRIAEIYRTTAIIHLQHLLRKDESIDSGILPLAIQKRTNAFNSELNTDQFFYHCQAIHLIKGLPNSFKYESSLLWPISIFAPDLTTNFRDERTYILNRLEALETKFCMKYFRSVRELLKEHWKLIDHGSRDIDINALSILQG